MATRLLVGLVLLCSVAAQQQPNTFSVPAGAVPALTTAWTTRAAAALRALAPSWMATLQARLLARGINIRMTERVLISPALRFFIGSTNVPLPLSLAELAQWAQMPAIPVSRLAFFPLQVLFRTQYYLASDYLAGVAPPNTTVPVVAGTGTRGRLRRLLGLAEGDRAAMRDALLARVIAEGPACVAGYTLETTPRRRLSATNSSSDALLDVWDADAAQRLLAHLHGVNKSAAFGSLLALTLQASVAAFKAQFVDTRFGVAATVINLPAADLSAFARKGVEIDVGADVLLRLAGPMRRQLLQEEAPLQGSAPPPPPPPQGNAPPVPDEGESLLALSLPADEPLPRNMSLLAANFIALLQAQAGAAGGVLGPLGQQLSAGRLTKSLNFLITPIVSLILGELSFSIPTTTAGLAAALAEPTLQALLSTTVGFTASISITFNIVFAASLPPLVIPLPHGRQLREGDALSPAELLQACRAFLASAGASVRVQELLASFTQLSYNSVSFQLYSGVFERDSVRKVATLNKTARAITTDANALILSSAFSIFAVTLSANSGVVGKLTKKPA